MTKGEENLESIRHNIGVLNGSVKKLSETIVSSSGKQIQLQKDISDGQIKHTKRITFATYVQAFMAFSLVVVGIFQGYIMYETGREQKEAKLERKKEQNEVTKLLLEEEFTHNYVNLQHLDEWLQKNRGYTDKEKRDRGSLEKAGVVIIDLFNLKFTAWEATKFNNPNYLTNLTKDDFQIFQNYYFNLDRLQTMVSHREAFRLSNFGDDWYAANIKTRDNNIMIKVREFEPFINKLGDYLFEGEDWKTRLGKFLW